jgi:hypothetical protein
LSALLLVPPVLLASVTAASVSTIAAAVAIGSGPAILAKSVSAAQCPVGSWVVERFPPTRRGTWSHSLTYEDEACIGRIVEWNCGLGAAMKVPD